MAFRYFASRLLLVLGTLASFAVHGRSQTPEQRHALQLPDTTVRTLLRNVWYQDRPELGYTAQEMALYNPDPYLLRTVSLLYGNAATVPRYGATLAAAAYATTDLAGLSRIAYGCTDVSAGRMMALAPDSLVVVDASPSELPRKVRRLVTRLREAAEDCKPWLDKAFSDDIFREALSWTTAADKERYAVQCATALWAEERMGQLAVKNPHALKMLQNVDRKSMAFASAIFLAHIDRALKEYAADSIPVVLPESRWIIGTPFGDIVVAGTGNDTLREPVFAVIDLGGNDTYLGRTATAIGPVRPLAVVIDLAGNDTYTATGDTLAIGAAAFGIGVLVDLHGNDTYHGNIYTIGAAFWGTAIVADMEGNDNYTIDNNYGQGAGSVGVGILDDRAGDDTYTCASEGQAFAQTYGAGFLIERNGNDHYIARLDGARSEMYLNQSVSRAQGAAFGRRADIGDGHSLAGGVALLADFNGNDSYLAGAWSQGCGYWWAAGFLEDWSGNDTYMNGKYSLGAAAHFAVGSIVDVAGNDSYNVDNAEAVNQYHGHARDGSIGVAFDGAGDDRYHFRKNCGGSADLCSIGLFWDRQGNDLYDVRYDMSTDQVGWTDTPPMGTATTYPAMYSYRDYVRGAGMFVDSQGDDTYTWNGSPDNLQAGRARNGNTFVSPRSPISTGLFIDVPTGTK